MKQSPMNVRVPDELKQEAVRILKRMGLSPSSAVRLFLSQVVRQRQIPFPIVGDVERTGLGGMDVEVEAEDVRQTGEG